MHAFDCARGWRLEVAPCRDALQRASRGSTAVPVLRRCLRRCCGGRVSRERVLAHLRALLVVPVWMALHRTAGDNGLCVLSSLVQPFQKRAEADKARYQKEVAAGAGASGSGSDV